LATAPANKKTVVRCLEAIKIPTRPTYDALARDGGSYRGGGHTDEDAAGYVAEVGTDIR